MTTTSEMALRAMLEQAVRYIEVSVAYQGAMTAKDVEAEIIRQRATLGVVQIAANSVHTLASFDLGKARELLQTSTIPSAPVLRAMAAVLQQPRNRFGKIESDHKSDGAFRNAAEAAGLFDKLPNGGRDMPDQIAMVLQAMCGDEPKSIMD